MGDIWRITPGRGFLAAEDPLADWPADPAPPACAAAAGDDAALEAALAPSATARRR